MPNRKLNARQIIMSAKGGEMKRDDGTGDRFLTDSETYRFIYGAEAHGDKCNCESCNFDPDSPTSDNPTEHHAALAAEWPFHLQMAVARYPDENSDICEHAVGLRSGAVVTFMGCYPDSASHMVADDACVFPSLGKYLAREGYEEVMSVTIAVDQIEWSANRRRVEFTDDVARMLRDVIPENEIN